MIILISENFLKNFVKIICIIHKNINSKDHAICTLFMYTLNYTMHTNKINTSRLLGEGILDIGTS